VNIGLLDLQLFSGGQKNPKSKIYKPPFLPLTMKDITSIEPQKYNAALAAAIKKEGLFPKPDWANFVKTGANKARPPFELDFWEHRAASILRQIYLKKIVGVERLRTRYGGRKDRGMKPPRFIKASGKIIRTILQQAESAGLVEKVKGKHCGRQLTPKGKEFLEKVASQIS